MQANMIFSVELYKVNKQKRKISIFQAGLSVLPGSAIRYSITQAKHLSI